MNSFLINQLNISNDFYWFQPNSRNIYKLQIDTNTWTSIENKSGIQFSEMFRVCQVNSHEWFITGGVINCLSSKSSIIFNDGISYIKEDMFKARRAHGTCLLNEEIYVCGGINSQGDSISQCEKYSLTEHKWKKVADMQTQRSHLSLCSFNHNFIYCFGGDINEILVDYIDCYNLELDNWTILPISLPYKIECCGVLQISPSDIIILGGYSNDPEALCRVLIFNEPEYKLKILSSKLSEHGWSIYNPIKIGSVVHMLYGGEGANIPNHIQFNYG